MSLTAVSPGKPTIAHAIERYFDVALYVLVLTGFVTLAATGGLDLPGVVGVGLALLFRGYQLAARREFAIPHRWTNYLTLLYIFVYFVDYFFVSRGFLVATVHLVLFLMLVRLFSLQRPRDHYWLAMLSFLMVLGATLFTVDSVFLFSFAGFLLIAVITFVLMEMRHSLAEEHARAQEPRIASAYGPWPQILLATAPLLVMLILAGSFLIFFLLPRVSSRYLSAYSPTGDLSTGFTDRVQLGRIGQIQQSSAVVMHIEIQNDLQGRYDLKWRGVALNRFDGKMWSNAFAPNWMRPASDGRYRLTAPSDPPTSPPIPGRRIHYRVVMEPLGTNVFFLTPKPITLSGDYRQLSIDSGGAVYNLDTDHPINRYEADSELVEPDQKALRLAPNAIPGGMDEYLKLPPLDLRISKMAEELTASAPSNYEKAAALERYLSTRFGYSLELPSNVPEDPLAYFLFERKKGHCEYFASSMAVMLRSLRIPSRMVTGFRTGEFNDLTGKYVVRASNAHSWVEAYFPGSGWVSFDPTPAAGLPTRSGWSRIQLYADAAASFWREWIINYDAEHQRALGQTAASNSRRFLDEMRRWVWRQHRAALRSAGRVQQRITRSPAHWIAGSFAVTAGLILLINLRLIFRAIRARNLRTHPERAPRESASLWYERMLCRMIRHGWRKSPSQTPREFVAAIHDHSLRQSVAAFTRAYESARFGHSIDDARALRGLLEDIGTEKR
jgi:protein-glutamine gamma-glutamyltransferase